MQCPDFLKNLNVSSEKKNVCNIQIMKYDICIVIETYMCVCEYTY